MIEAGIGTEELGQQSLPMLLYHILVVLGQDRVDLGHRLGVDHFYNELLVA